MKVPDDFTSFPTIKDLFGASLVPRGFLNFVNTLIGYFTEVSLVTARSPSANSTRGRTAQTPALTTSGQSAVVLMTSHLLTRHRRAAPCHVCSSVYSARLPWCTGHSLTAAAAAAQLCSARTRSAPSCLISNFCRIQARRR